MHIQIFDKISALVIVLSLLFSLSVAYTSWRWFPTPGDWGDIARIPSSMVNYAALLLPPTVTLACLLTRRLYFKKEF